MKIVLATLHSRYSHASLALPSLAAACAGIPGVRVAVREFTVNEPQDPVLRALAAEEGDIFGFSCYLWNIEATLRLVSDLKLIRPDCVIVLGGPEVSFGSFELMQLNPAVDCIVKGEGEAAFTELVNAIKDGTFGYGGIAGLICRDGDDIIAGPERDPVAELDNLPSPFAGNLATLDKPLVYLETSRGCPFSCAFCISALDDRVRSYSPQRIESDLAILMKAEAATIKFVDRTFNYDADRANCIWEFILAGNISSRFHFEIAADLLTDRNIDLLKRVPADTFRFEIGVQSGDAATLAQVGRRSDLARLYGNVRRLKEETAVVLHLDLVAGLPLEGFEGFLASLDPVLALAPHHVQIEPLKVLKGAPMRRIAAREGYRFSPSPPYKILQTPWLAFEEIGRIETIGRLIDLVYNSGRFATLLKVAEEDEAPSATFAALAVYWEERRLPGSLPLERLFVEIGNFCDSRAAAERRELYREALGYDCLLSGLPATGSPLPVMSRIRLCRDPLSREELERRTGGALSAGLRVRQLTATFHHDFRSYPFAPRTCSLLFIFLSGKENGLRVEVAER